MSSNFSGSGAVELLPKIPKIPKIHPHIRETHPSAYTPTIVSIGPYHHNNPQLKATDYCLKSYYHRRFLLRNSNVDAWESRLLLLREKLPQIRSYYSENVDVIVNMGDEDFLDMLVVDGCFIIELFLLINEQKAGELFNISNNLQNLIYDMLLVENQLPLFVLDILFELACPQDRSLLHLAADFFDRLLPGNHCKQWLLMLDHTKSYNHLLHLFYSLLTGTTDHQHATNFGRGGYQMIPRANDLVANTGIKIKPKDDTRSFFWNISYQNGGVLEVSPVKLLSGSLYRNLIAFEQMALYQKVTAGKSPVTAYVMLMGCLIDSKEDWDVMVRQGVIDNVVASDSSTLRGNKATCNNFFRDIVDETVMDYKYSYDTNLGDLSIQIGESYCENINDKDKRSGETIMGPQVLLPSIVICGVIILAMFNFIFGALAGYINQP